jgi:hypothetical protein
MGFSKTTASWFPVLGYSKGAETAGSPIDDAFDAMEKGFANKLVPDQLKPQASKAPRRQMCVKRSSDRLTHFLYNEDGTQVLEAKTSNSCVKVFGSVGDVRASASTPAFTLSFDKDKRDWTLTSSHCEFCQYRVPSRSCKARGGQTLAFMRHAKEELGGGVAMCMDVDIPAINADGSSVVWCPSCSGAEEERLELTSLRPKWNSKVGSLCMDFKGRVDAASAKNFQLCFNDEVVLMYGKKSDGDFILDFEHPLSPAQAFAIALTTMFWT